MEEQQINTTDDLLTAIYIQTTRIYDVLLVMLSLQNSEFAAEIMASHERGEVMSPPPALLGSSNEG